MGIRSLTRFSSDVQKANAAGKQDKIAQLKEMLALVDDAERVLTDKNADLDDFGRMLDHTWKLKRQTGAAVSTNSIDELYAKGMAAGALGGKLLGAGGGGFLVFYVQPERQDSVRWAMRDLMHIPFAFEDGGTRKCSEYNVLYIVIVCFFGFLFDYIISEWIIPYIFEME